MTRRILIFANPISGSGRGRVVAGQLKAALQEAKFEADVYFDRPATIDAAGLPQAEAALCVGGDGTLRAVVEMYAGATRRPPPLLPIPMGTANLLGRHFGVNWSSAELTAGVLATVRRAKTVQFDAATANGHRFMLMAGIGLDAHVVHLLDEARTGPISYASYLMPAAMTLLNYRFPPLSIQVDGTRVFDGHGGIAFIGNVREYGTGFPILVDARPDDGLLDVCILPCNDWRDLAALLLSVGTGDHPRREGVIYTRGREVRVLSTEPVPVQLDGDSAGFTPLSIQIVPGGVSFLLPA